MNQFKPKGAQLLAFMAIALCAFVPSLLIAATSDEEPARLDAEQARLDAEQTRLEMLQDASLQRQEALMEAIAQVRESAELAAVEARRRAEELRAETESLRAERHRHIREAGEERTRQLEDIARLRQDLSRTHNELRAAQREVARASRDLALSQDRRIRTRLINLGDRRIIGVILGDQTEDGITIRGVSPGGPAEKAGIQTGDILTSLRGESLAVDDERRARERVFEVLNEVGEDEEISASVLRDGERWDFMVTPEIREPASWQSHIRLPEAPGAPLPTAEVEIISSSPHVIVERIAVPHVNEVELAAEVARIGEELENLDFVFSDEFAQAFDQGMDFIPPEGFDFEFDTEAFSDIGAMAMSEANVWYATPFSHGVRLAEINEGLGEYFRTDRGALVLEAPDDNPFELRAGDVVLSIGGREVNSTSDFVRALRGYQQGESIELSIKRNKRDEKLVVELPENRFGFVYGKLHGEPERSHAPHDSEE